MSKVDQNHTYAPCNTVYLVIFLIKIPCMHRIFGDFPDQNTVYAPNLVIFLLKIPSMHRIFGDFHAHVRSIQLFLLMLYGPYMYGSGPPWM